MGFESFQVVFRGRQNIDLSTFLGTLHGLIVEKCDDPAQLIVRDGKHVFEFEVGCEDEEVKVSLRFSVCHPVSVEQAFIDIVRSISEGLDMSIHILDEVPKGLKYDYQPSNLDGLDVAIESAIALQRQLWVLEVGSETAPVTCGEAIMRFVVGVL